MGEKSQGMARGFSAGNHHVLCVTCTDERKESDEENNHHQLNKITLSNKSIEWMDDTIINISSQMIDGFNRYLNLFEIVSIEEEDKKLARIRFQYFKDRGYNIQSIDAKKT